MNSWMKVAGGARLVVSAVLKQVADDGAVAASRITNHGLDLSSRARQTAMASQEVLQQRTVNGVWDGNSEPEPFTRSAGPNPYESQWRKEKTQEPAPKTTNINGSSRAEQKERMASIPNPYLLHAEVPQSSMDVEPQVQMTTTSNSDMVAKRIELFNSEKEPFTGAASPPSSSLESSMDASSTTILAADNTDIQQQDDELVRMKEGRAVPSSRLGRAAGFASLGLGLAWGTVSNYTGRLLRGGGGEDGQGNAVSSDANADRLAATLCRMRGAALKMGQMLSIQDESLLPPALTRALNQVRQGADAMPNYQLVRQMESQLGKDWRDQFESFDEHPFAAASIGQVHRASIRNHNDDDDDDGSIRQVVVKVQYPGVANSIESDLRNLTMLVKLTGLAPKGLFLENVIRVGREELKVECNYLNESANQQAFKQLVEDDPYLRSNNVTVPAGVENLTTEQVLVTDFAPGGTIDKVKLMDQEERNRIGRVIMYLTMRELFVWRLMQTDPNWGNFLYDTHSRQTTLIDFGATREYSKEFVDGYLRIVWANANRDETTLMEQSRKMGFLTGEENDLMLNAHKQSGFTLGEPFAADEPFDFQGSRISSRMSEHTSVFLKHRLTPPPEEVYTLHRKLAGAFMLCIRLGAFVECRGMLKDIVRQHTFDDGLPHPLSQIELNE